jgi:hypothetical protein
MRLIFNRLNGFYSSIVVKQASERPVSVNNGALKICKLNRDQNVALAHQKF